MDNSKDNEERYKEILISTYLFCKSLYSFTFKERIGVDLDMIMFTPSFHNRDLDRLSNEELEKKLNSLKKPWWNNFYIKHLHKYKKRLLLIFLLMIRRDYSWSGLKLIWKILKTKNKDLEE